MIACCCLGVLLLGLFWVIGVFVGSWWVFGGLVVGSCGWVGYFGFGDLLLGSWFCMGFGCGLGWFGFGGLWWVCCGL